jgi:hypothetical protein
LRDVDSNEVLWELAESLADGVKGAVLAVSTIPSEAVQHKLRIGGGAEETHSRMM